MVKKYFPKGRLSSCCTCESPKSHQQDQCHHYVLSYSETLTFRASHGNPAVWRRPLSTADLGSLWRYLHDSSHTNCHISLSTVCATLVKKQPGPQLLHGQTQGFPTLCHHVGPLTSSQNSKSCVCVCLIHFAGWQTMTSKSFFSYPEFCASLTKESKNQKKIIWYKSIIKCREHNNFKQK